MSLPLVSVVTPSHNQARWLDETICSVLGQDYPHIEYLVVDGGSTDGSVEIIRRHADRLAWWTTEPDEGQAEALNRGFRRASGEILGWINADDVLLPGAISTVVAALRTDPRLLLVYGDNDLVDEEGRVFQHLPARDWNLPQMLRTCQNHVPQPGSLFTRRAWELVGPLDGGSYYYFDTRFVLELALHGPARRLDRTLALYRIHPASKSGGTDERKAADHVRVFNGFVDRLGLPPEVATVARETRARSYFVASEHAYAALGLASARRYFVLGLLTDPRRAGRRAVAVGLRSLLPRVVVSRLRARRAAPARSAPT